jgi:hypothetical protein
MGIHYFYTSQSKTFTDEIDFIIPESSLFNTAGRAGFTTPSLARKEES